MLNPRIYFHRISLQQTNKMKTFLFAAITAILFASCAKQTNCIGTDCVLPEAAIAIDSVTNNGIYVRLPNNEGGFFACTLELASNINQEEFIEAASAYTTASPIQGNENQTMPMLKVYYVAEDQSYVRENARYIHATNNKLEIISYGNNLEID